MIQQEQEQLITYHTVTLGALTRSGDALAAMSEQDEEKFLRGEDVPAAPESASPAPSGETHKH